MCRICENLFVENVRNRYIKGFFSFLNDHLKIRTMFSLQLNKSFISTGGRRSPSTESAMLHCRLSTAAQNGQSKHWLQRGTFSFFLSLHPCRFFYTLARGERAEGYSVGWNLKLHCFVALQLRSNFCYFSYCFSNHYIILNKMKCKIYDLDIALIIKSN